MTEDCYRLLPPVSRRKPVVVVAPRQHREAGAAVFFVATGRRSPLITPYYGPTDRTWIRLPNGRKMARSAYLESIQDTIPQPTFRLPSDDDAIHERFDALEERLDQAMRLFKGQQALQRAQTDKQAGRLDPPPPMDKPARIINTQVEIS